MISASHDSILEGSRRSEGAFACTVSLMKASIALQYSNDLWNSRTAPCSSRLSSLLRVFGAVSVSEITNQR